MIKKGCAVLVVGVIGFMLCGCEKHPEDAEIISVVYRYNQALIEAYSKMNFNSLKDVATEQEYRKVMVYINSYAGLNQRINARLIGFRIEKVEGKRRDLFYVFTSETWEYERVDIETGRILNPERRYIYKMRYEIVRDRDDRWKVNGLKVLEEVKI
jgi:hypothetical protein